MTQLRTSCWGRSMAFVMVAIACAGAVLGAFQAQQEEFTPATQLGEQLPGAPFVFAAYAFCWIAVLGYVFVLWRRLGRLQRELIEVNAKSKRHA